MLELLKLDQVSMVPSSQWLSPFLLMGYIVCSLTERGGLDVQKLLVQCLLVILSTVVKPQVGKALLLSAVFYVPKCHCFIRNTQVPAISCSGFIRRTIARQPHVRPSLIFLFHLYLLLRPRVINDSRTWLRIIVQDLEGVDSVKAMILKV